MPVFATLNNILVTLLGNIVLVSNQNFLDLPPLHLEIARKPDKSRDYDFVIAFEPK